MTCRAIGVALTLSCLPVAGCGTVANLAAPGPEGGGKASFGGVKRDMEQLKAADEMAAGGASQPHPKARTVAAAVDLPFSFVGDVVTWPYVVTYSYINQPVPVTPVIEVPPLPANAPQQRTTYEPALYTPTTTDDKPKTLPAPTP